MNEHETDIGEWRSLGGAPVGDGNDDADAVFAHVSDLHGQLTPRYQVYYDNPTSTPDFNFRRRRSRRRARRRDPLLAAKLDELREDYDVCTLMSGDDTFHGSAVTTYRWASDARSVNDHVAPDIYVPGTGTTRTRPPGTATSWS